MPYTFSGRSVKPRPDTQPPSLIDIAVGLSRQPRFAGQGRRWFSVLDHTLFCDELAKRNDSVPLLGSDDEEARRRWRLAMLLHDAHEAITADVPTTFKNDALRLAQVDLDVVIANAYYPGGFAHFGSQAVTEAVKWIDRRALVAEAMVIGPPVEYERILHAFGSTDTQEQDVEVLHIWLDLGLVGVPPTTWEPDKHPGVKKFLQRYLELR